jgi:peptidoglycan/xylan/chitin deacetylase (PgdA/CDA1 family)
MKAIITFHSIDDAGSVLSFSPHAFARLLESLATSQTPVLTLDQLLKPETTSGVALTFDDGMRSVYDDALPVLADFHAPAHLFLAAGAVGKTNRWPGQPVGAPDYKMLDWDKLGALSERGVRIEAHTLSHPDLRKLSDDAVREEFQGCDDAIAERVGRAPAFFAYPYGFFDARLERLAGKRYAGSVTTRLDYLKPTDRPSALPRLDSYYLQPSFVMENLGSVTTRSYIALRAALRSVRSFLWNRDHA